MRRLVSLSMPVLTGLTLLVTGCGKPKVIKIASQCPLSGPQESGGTPVMQGAQLAAELLAGPLEKMGFKVEFVAFDDKADPETGVSNAKKIVEDPSILAIIGHYNSGVELAASEFYHTANLCNVSPSNTHPKVTDRGYLEVNRVCGRDDVQGSMGAQFLKKKDLKTVYVLHDTTPYGQGIASVFKKEAEALGIRVVGLMGTKEKTDFSALVTTVNATKPEAIYFGGTYDTAAFFKQVREKGFKGTFVSDDGLDSPETAKLAGDALVTGGGTYFSTVAGPAFAYADTNQFISDFKVKYNASPQPYAAQAYDATALALKAIENAAKAADGKIPARIDVCKAIRAIKAFPGSTGAITFNNKGDLELARYFIIQVTTADPARWGTNRIDLSLPIPPPN